MLLFLPTSSVKSQSEIWSLGANTYNFNSVSPIGTLPIGDPVAFAANYPSFANNPTDAQKYVYNGDKPVYAQNLVYDDNGKIKFFVVDGNIYDHEGVLLGDGVLNNTGVSFSQFRYFLPEGHSEISIIPVPNGCNQYYIVAASMNDNLGYAPGNTQRDLLGNLSLYYYKIDFNELHNDYSDRYGLITSVNQISADVPECGSMHLAVSKKINSTENRFLFVNSCGELFKCVINNTGIFANYQQPLLANNMDRLANFRAEMEIFENNNLIKTASISEIDINWNGNPNLFFPVQFVEIKELNASSGEGDFPSNDGRRIFYLSFSSDGLTSRNITGLEFSPSGEVIYVITKEFPYVWLANIDQTTIPSIGNDGSSPTFYTLGAIPGIPVDATFEGSQIETGPDGKLYLYAGKDNLIIINDPNNSSNPNPTVYSPSVILDNYASQGGDIYLSSFYYSCHILIDQIDGENYASFNASTPECCSKSLVYDLDYYQTINDAAVNNTETWSPGLNNNPWDDIDGVVYIENELRISGGYNITINGMVFKFGINGKMIIDRYAKVTSNNSTFTSVECEGVLWQGIEVWGFSNINQSLINNTQQGKFILSNCTVENAINGITACRLNNGVYQLSHTGGIIRATSCNFNNNRRDVDFQTYLAPNGANNMSFFNSSSFTTNGLLKDASVLNHHVNLTRVKGIYFTYCTFKNATPNLYPAIIRGTGIRSYDSYFIVQEGCSVPQLYPNPCPVGNQLPSLFENLLYGINAFSLNPLNTATIKNNQFTNCNRGIFLRSIDNATLYNNTFDVGSDYVFFGTNRSYGIYLDNCSAYNFSENDFTTTHNGYYGGYINNSGVDFNKVYHNTITGLKEGMVASAKNDGSVSGDGLDYQCNIFNNDKTVDIGVVLGGYQAGTPDIGVSDLQGNCIVVNQQPLITSPANNVFTNPSPSIPNVNGISGDLWQNTGVDHADYHFTGSPTLKTEPVNINLIGNTSLSDCSTPPTNFTPITNINSVCPTYSIVKLRSLIFAETSQLKNIIATNSALIDGGNTQARIDYINNTSQAWQIRDYLMNYDPYLSDAVLLALINKTPPIPSWVIEEVLGACTPVSDDVLLALVNRNPQVPAYILRDLFVDAKPVRKDVMIALINKSGIPDWVIREVCIANSPLTDAELLALLQRQQPLTASTINDIFMLNTPLTPQVKAAFESRNPKIPNWVKNNIYNSTFVAAHPNTRQKATSPVQDLLNENAVFEKSVQLNYQELIRQYINDTTVVNSADSILYIYKIGGMPRSKCKQVKALLYKGDYANAELLNDTIRSFNVTELNVTCTMTDMILQIYRDTAGCYKLMDDLALKQEFETKAGESLTCKECCQAQAILEIVFGTKFAEGFDDLVPEIAPRSAIATDESQDNENLTSTVPLNVKLYPNPNNGTFTLGYFPENDLSLNSVKVYDLTGKLIYSESLNMQAGSTRDFRLMIPSGIYIAEIEDELGSKQIIKISVTE